MRRGADLSRIDSCYDCRRSVLPETTMSETSALTVRLPAELTAKVESLADSLDRPAAWVVEKAVEEYVETRNWQVAAIRSALAQAEAGDFATDAEVRATFAKLIDAR
jgi:predicted transcriptional regulator